MTGQHHPPPWHNTHNAISGLHYARSRQRLEKDQAENEFHLLDNALQDIAARAHYSSTDQIGREHWRAPKRDQRLRMIIDPRGADGEVLPRLVWVGLGKPPASVWTP